MKLTVAALMPLALLIAQSSCPSNNPIEPYELRVVKTQGGQYDVEGKSPGTPFEVKFAGHISWNIKNETGAGIRIRLALASYRCLSSGGSETGVCPLRITTGGTGERCEAAVTIADNAPGLIEGIAEEQACAYADDPGRDLIDFAMLLTPEGQVERPVDPQLQIDRGGRGLTRRTMTIIIAAGAIGLVVYWLFFRRRRRS